MLLWKICNGSFFLVGGLTVILISYMIFISQFLDVNMMPISTIFSLPQLDINNKNKILTANLDVTIQDTFCVHLSVCLYVCEAIYSRFLSILFFHKYHHHPHSTHQRALHHEIEVISFEQPTTNI